MNKAIIKAGVCVYTGALVRVLEYGKVQRADVFKVGQLGVSEAGEPREGTIIVRFKGSIHDGQWQDQAEFTHSLLLGLDGFLLEQHFVFDEDGEGILHVAAVPLAQFEGELKLPGGGILDLKLGQPAVWRV